MKERNYDRKKLVEAAFAAQKRSYSPYSHFEVGAALLTAEGRIYSGCNIENASFPAGNCAERTAFVKAVSEGVKEFKAIAIVGGMEDATELEYCSPCGVCRQVMSEFCKDDFVIICAKSEDEYKLDTLVTNLPERFGPKDLLG